MTYYEEHKEQLCARSKKWRETNRQRHLTNCRSWHIKNNEKQKEYRKSYSEV